MTANAPDDTVPRSGSLIRDLVAMPTVSRDSNRDIIAFIGDLFETHGITPDIIWNADRTKANLWATIGPDDEPGVVLSGHTDVVPVDGQDWTGDPFEVRETDGLLYGRGTADMKGYIAVALSFVPELLERDLPRPVHFAFSYDEEVGCLGVASLISHLNARAVRPALCIVGEPTGMSAMIGHKGGHGYRVRVRGTAAHSSLAPRAVNAISYAAELIGFLNAIGDDWRENGPFDDAFDIPHSTLSVNQIEAGTAINIVPDLCTFAFEFRHLDAVDPDAVAARIMAYARELEVRMRETAAEAGIDFDQLFAFRSLDMDPGHAAVDFVKSLVGSNAQAKVAFGTEAGFFHKDGGVPTIVCGPGHIAQAHKPDEFVAIDQLAACEQMMTRLFDAMARGTVDWH